ncbi:MAG: lysylphosphatidylglycerol synthase transmembrane domain-containing protein [Prevotellaceae bacterium]|nr:lysylphosphatidylglycerol synthase transmembrane domain-containing protein [Prevotellaceae bacterium]MDY3856405.1 lysylphosphatidylglycerol synthase transmembrane domain-containing protein [Bacteroidaceae bacterium]
MTPVIRRSLEVTLSLLLAFAILWWLYRDFPFSEVGETLRHGVRWHWMAISLLFGIFPQILRGIRWRMALEPLGQRPTVRHCIYAIYMSFAASLVIPRIGEVSRCATLKRTDGTHFSTALGTVVTERIIDSLLVLLIIGITFLCALPSFMRFFANIGLDRERFFETFSPTGILVTAVCLGVLIAGGIIIYRRLEVGNRLKDKLSLFVQGIASVRRVRYPWLYGVFTLAIWICYFLHFYLAFFAFDFTSNLGLKAGMLAFCMITVAVLVPTPNGAGPWHFAVKVVLMQFGVSASKAILFALIVHALQTLLVILLGLYGLIRLRLERVSHIQFIESNHN